MSRRGRAWVILALLMGVVMVAMAAFVPVPFVSRSPGPVFDILGEYDGKPVLEVSGAESYPTTGRLDMTTVAEYGGASGPILLPTAIVGLFQPDASVIPDGGAQPGDEQAQIAVFDASTSDALGAAAKYLDRPVHSEPIVVAVVPGSGSDGKLEAGDVIESINGEQVRHADQIGGMVQDRPVGAEFEFVVRRGDGTLTRTVRSRPDPDDPQQPLVGITVDDQYTSDFDVTVNLAQIGGPSAGLMLALGMVDKLTPGDLLAGGHVAGTGTINGDGAVGEIGGIDKKLLAAREAGAEVFLAPERNCEETLGVTPEGLTVAPVASLSDAVDVIEDWRKGQALPTCSGTDSDG